MITQNSFLEKYNYIQKDFESTGLVWEDLEAIHDDYLSIIPQLESTAELIFNSLRKINEVHSVKFRIKDPEHLIEKIIRKKIKDKKSNINLENYRTEITDLIGLRVLHLFKGYFKSIHSYIINTWDLKEDSKPTINFRSGDNVSESSEFNLKEHPAGYRSVHYIINSKPTKEIFNVEIQVRTIYEEAWSEIDHIIRYPYFTDNDLINENLQILNRLSGSADEMGIHIIKLKEILLNYEKELNEKDNLILSLSKKVEKLNINETEKEELERDISKLKTVSKDVNKFDIKPVDLSFLNVLPDFDVLKNKGFINQHEELIKSIRESTKNINLPNTVRESIKDLNSLERIRKNNTNE